MRRDPDAAAQIRAQAERSIAGGHRRALAAAAAAGGAIEVPGVVRPAVNGVVGLRIEKKLRDIGLPDQDCPGRAQALDKLRILEGQGRLPGLEADCRGGAGDIEALLHGHRHSVQRPPLGASLVGFPSVREGLVEERHHHGVETVVRCLDQLEVRPHGLGRGNAS